MNYELTILMPCLNEEETLGICISKAKKAIDENNITAEILIADNGSTDKSIKIAKELGARVVQVEEKGYGNALIAGIENAKGKYIIMGDSDDSYNFAHFPIFIEKLKEGYDLVMGNRFKGGIESNAMPFLHKYLGNPVLSFIGRLFFKIPVNDFHCGLRAFNKESILSLNLSTTGMEFASEMVVKSAMHKLKIGEVPTTLSKDGRSKPPHLNTWRDGWRHLRFLLMYSPKWLFLYPGLFLFFAGLIISSLLLINPITIRSVTFDIHTMLYFSMFMIVGFQSVMFYFLSRIYAIKIKLIPDNTGWIKRFEKFFSLEKGIITSITILFVGIGLAIYSFIIWSNKSFGDLNPTEELRLVIPSVTLIILGVQMFFNSFFTSILCIKTK